MMAEMIDTETRREPDAATRPTCRICGCTESAPCFSGCEWVELGGASGLCSVCAVARYAIGLYFVVCREVTSESFRRLVAEAAELLETPDAVLARAAADAPLIEVARG
jgi:hypothetical protein